MSQELTDSEALQVYRAEVARLRKGIQDAGTVMTNMTATRELGRHLLRLLDEDL